MLMNTSIRLPLPFLSKKSYYELNHRLYISLNIYIYHVLPYSKLAAGLNVTQSHISSMDIQQPYFKMQ
jgi:hypothetical protein